MKLHKLFQLTTQILTISANQG